ncbi:uncharacterized protein [Apostichopus japonicus]|uniref:uncharacterized protein isoform X2 n=1 Tax=Stichopus japonicus TaxID=307972 RepID=UPI003AB3614A
MENKAFSPDEDGPQNVNDHDERTNENGKLDKEDISADVTSSPNIQEIIAIVHPEPPEIELTTSTTADQSATDKPDDLTPDKEVKYDNSTETAISNTLEKVTKDIVKENQNTDENHNKPPQENGHAQIKDTETTATSPSHLDTEQGNTLPNGEAPTRNGQHETDLVITVPETVTSDRRYKSHWYYFFIMLLFFGFVVALVIGLIYGRD